MSTPVTQGAPLTRGEFASQLERASQRVASYPVTAAMLRALSEVLKQSEPAWWLKTAKAWERRRFTAWHEAWGLFLTAVHYEALKDPENPLVPYFPSCGGTPEADPGRALMRFLNEADSSFYARLEKGHRRNYVPARAGWWIIPSFAFFHSRGMPFYLIETDAGAGLNLAADLNVKLKGYDPSLIAARIGLDPDPLDLQDIEHRRWLTGGLYPDAVESIQAMDAAADLLIARQKKEAAFVQLAPCAAELAPAFIRKNVPVDQECGLLLLNMAATGRLNDLQYQAYCAEVARLMQDWGGRALWLEVETVRGELFSTTYQFRMQRLVEGQLKTHIASSIDFASHAVQADEKTTLAFLTP
jgi:hypothetical protein